MFSNQTRPSLLLDIFAFLIHLAVSAGFVLLGVLLKAPLFGVRAEPYEIFQATIFFLLAFVIFIAGIFLITKGTFAFYLGVVGASLFAAVVWSVWISSYDMIFFIFGYLLLVIPILIIKHKIV